MAGNVCRGTYDPRPGEKPITTRLGLMGGRLTEIGGWVGGGWSPFFRWLKRFLPSRGGGFFIESRERRTLVFNFLGSFWSNVTSQFLIEILIKFENEDNSSRDESNIENYNKRGPVWKAARPRQRKLVYREESKSREQAIRIIPHYRSSIVSFSDEARKYQKSPPMDCLLYYWNIISALRDICNSIDLFSETKLRE